MKLVPYKFEIVGVCHVLDDEGKIVAEQSVGQKTKEGSFVPTTVFGVAGLIEWAEGFEAQIEKAAKVSQ